MTWKTGSFVTLYCGCTAYVIDVLNYTPAHFGALRVEFESVCEWCSLAYNIDKAGAFVNVHVFNSSAPREKGLIQDIFALTVKSCDHLADALSDHFTN